MFLKVAGYDHPQLPVWVNTDQIIRIERSKYGEPGYQLTVGHELSEIDVTEKKGMQIVEGFLEGQSK